MAVARNRNRFLCYCYFLGILLIMIELKNALGCDTQLFKS